MMAGSNSIIGREVLGPIFTIWAHLLLRIARRRKLRRLVFVARDGDLLQRATAQLLSVLACDGEFELGYLHLSRRVTQLAAHPAIDRSIVAEAMAVRAGTPTLASLLAYLGISTRDAEQVLAGHGLTGDIRLTSVEHGIALLRHPALGDFLATESARQSRAVCAYLDGCGMLRDESSVLIDIGWRGSIQRNLDDIIAEDGRGRTPPWLYFGLWREDGRAAALPDRAEGLLGDLRRGRTLLESSPWQAGFLLEAVCRGDEGTVLSFHHDGESWVPLLAAPDSPARQAEQRSNDVTVAVRAGILEHIAAHGADPRLAHSDDVALREEAQQRLLRLAFLPTTSEIDLGESLVHTESHNPGWSTPLVRARTASPFTAPRHWLAGLASPWRGAYVMASGGRPLALAYRSMEALLLSLPPAARSALRRRALNIAGDRTPHS